MKPTVDLHSFPDWKTWIFFLGPPGSSGAPGRSGCKFIALSIKKNKHFALISDPGVPGSSGDIGEPGPPGKYYSTLIYKVEIHLLLTRLSWRIKLSSLSR